MQASLEHHLTGGNADLVATADRRLAGPPRAFARLAWIILAALALGLFMFTLPLYYEQLRTVCSAQPCNNRQMTPEQVYNLRTLGLSIDLYATYLTGLSIVFASVYAATGILIFARRSDEPVALLVSLMLVIFGVGFQGSLRPLGAPERVHHLAPLIEMLGFVLAVLVFYLFPNGRFVPGYARWLALIWIVDVVTAPVVRSVAHPPFWLGLLNFIGFFIPRVFSVGAQVYRYRRVSNHGQRQQVKWAMFGMVMALSGVLVVSLLVMLFPGLVKRSAVANMVISTGLTVCLLLIPISLGIAVLRYRLWDIDPIINRTLVYGGLTASIAGIYVLIVGYLGAMFNARGNLLVSLVATSIVAVLFQPLRERLQRMVNRMMYGGRDDPYAVLSALGQRLESTLAPDAVLPTIIATIKEALKLPYAAIAIRQDEAFVVTASSGEPSGDALLLPLVYQHEPVGQLILTPRASGESFSGADHRLLDDVARQAGIAVHAVRLTHDLQQSRERLVTAREEERRRLRRNLHDGLGPTLASLTMKLDAAQTLVVDEPPAGVALLREIQQELKATIGNVRQLVYALRPPVLDQFGLVAAIREHAVQLNAVNVQWEIDAPQQLLGLPAAVEVAAYYIAVEALTNVARHAEAQHCTIRLRLDTALQLGIVDDGRGIPADYRTGVGVQSMRERAEELGGTCVVEAIQPHGTRVRTTLPVR